MLFISPDSIKELVIDRLCSGPIKTTELISQIGALRPQTTKQAVYTAIRNLRKDEVVISLGMKTSLNIRWLQSMEERLGQAFANYHSLNGDKGSYLNLRDGERIEYYFGDVVETDAFWWQALYQLAATSSTNEPVYLYNPHQWFLLARRESELDVIKAITEKQKQFLQTVAGNTPLDKHIATDFDGNLSQYYMAGQFLFPKQNYYLNIIDDYMIEVFIDPQLAENIERHYQNTEAATEESMKQLKEIVSVKGKGKLIISRKFKKADKLKKLFRKHFYIKNTSD